MAIIKDPVLKLRERGILESFVCLVCLSVPVSGSCPDNIL